MLLDEFLVWDAPDGGRWQLVDGEPRAMAPASDVHGTMQSELGRLIGTHLAAAVDATGNLLHFGGLSDEQVNCDLMHKYEYI